MKYNHNPNYKREDWDSDDIVSTKKPKNKPNRFVEKRMSSALKRGDIDELGRLDDED